MTLKNLINSGIISVNQSVSILDESRPMDYSMHRFNLFNMSAINHNKNDKSALENYGDWEVCFLYTSHVGDPNQDNDIFVKLKNPSNSSAEVKDHEKAGN